MKLVVFSDIHYAPEPPIHNNSIIQRKLTNLSIPLVEKLINRINTSIKPDVVINLGDLIEDFNDSEKDIKNFSFIWNKLKQIKMPFYSVIGNHDLHSLKNDEDIKKIMGYDNLTFSVDMKGYHLVFLGLTINRNMKNTSDKINKTRVISAKDLEWLKKDLENNELPCLVFTHFGLAEDDMKGNWWFEHCKEHALFQNREEMKGIIEKNDKILAVFSGHQHWTKTTIENGITYHVVGSLTEDINNNGIPDGVYLEVDIEQCNLEVSRHHISLDS